jgi:hypothetical protein
MPPQGKKAPFNAPQPLREMMEQAHQEPQPKTEGAIKALDGERNDAAKQGADVQRDHPYIEGQGSLDV